ncbi:MAG: Uma2 family endonuclease [Chloroflexota bacterium]|nr:Uma2 family endonuclease [Chloroflexota bacterium]
MTTAQPANPPAVSLPDIPRRHPDDITSTERLHEPGQTHHLSQYLVNPDTTLVTGDRYVNSEQGKPPDFILEVASQYTASADLGPKKDYYEVLGVGEYWLFDSEARFYGFTLRGYRLVNGKYEEIEVHEIRTGYRQRMVASTRRLIERARAVREGR